MCDISLATSIPSRLTSFSRAWHGIQKLAFLRPFTSSHSSANPWLCFPKAVGPHYMAVSASVFSFKSQEHALHVSRKSTSSNACLSETPKNTTGIHMLFRDPKTSNVCCDEPCARLSKNTIKSFYVPGFPYKTSTTARFHFSFLLLSLQHSELPKFQNMNNRKERPSLPSLLFLKLQQLSRCCITKRCSQPPHVCPNPKIDISDVNEGCAVALSKLLNLFSSVTWSLGLLHKIPTTLYLSTYSPTLQNDQSVFSKKRAETLMLASGFSSSYPSKALAQYDMCE